MNAYQRIQQFLYLSGDDLSKYNASLVPVSKLPDSKALEVPWFSLRRHSNPTFVDGLTDLMKFTCSKQTDRDSAWKEILRCLYNCGALLTTRASSAPILAQKIKRLFGGESNMSIMSGKNTSEASPQTDERCGAGR
jgi:hypothetical protein